MNSTWVKHAISEINADYQRSADTYYNAEWVQANIGDVEPWKAQISQLVK